MARAAALGGGLATEALCSPGSCYAKQPCQMLAPVLKLLREAAPGACWTQVEVVPLRNRCLLCRRTASFGPRGAARKAARHCMRHRTAQDVNLVARMCREHGCGKRATYGDGEARTGQGAQGAGGARALMFCRRHKRSHDVDLVHLKCSHAGGCRRVACFAFPPAQEPPRDSGKSDKDSERRWRVAERRCKAHRLPGQVAIE